MLAIDPNVIYLFLILGLWLGVTATYMPGTGLLEVVSAVIVIGALVALGNMPTNWGAVIILIAGVLLFIVMPFVQQQLVPLAVGGLLLQAGGSLFMFNGLSVSPALIGLIVVLSLAYHRYVLIPTLEKVRTQAPVDDDAALLGASGKVVKALDPVGTVNVHGELWTATSDRPLPSGEEVIVVERDGLNIVVEGVKHKRAPLNGLNGHEE
jgi:membrane-bound serine protease (ClpP class)